MYLTKYSEIGRKQYLEKINNHHSEPQAHGLANKLFN